MKTTPAAGEVVGNNEVRLVPLVPDIDTQQVFELANQDSDHMRSFDLGSGHFASLESTHKHLQEMYENGLTFFIQSSGQMVGNLYITESSEPQLARLSYWVAKSHTGRGICSEAVRQAIDFTFTDLRKVGILAGVALTNTPSLSILKKTGFVKIDSQTLNFEGGPVEVGVFGLMNPDMTENT